MYEQADLLRRKNQIHYFRHAPPHLERVQPQDAYSGNRPAPPYQGAQGWKCSIYYYWWRFVREIPNLREKLDRPSAHYPIDSILPDFERVFDMNFREWWALDGRKLFCEPRTSGVEIERPPVHADGFEDRILFSIPLKGDLDQAVAELRLLLKPEMAKFKAEEGPSRARYPVVTNPALSALDTFFRVHRARRDHPDLNHYELYDFMHNQLGKVGNDVSSKASKSSTISRYLSKIDAILHYVELGLFPAIERNDKFDAWAARLAEDRRRRVIKLMAERTRSNR